MNTENVRRYFEIEFAHTYGSDLSWDDSQIVEKMAEHADLIDGLTRNQQKYYRIEAGMRASASHITDDPELAEYAWTGGMEAFAHLLKDES